MHCPRGGKRLKLFPQVRFLGLGEVAFDKLTAVSKGDLTRRDPTNILGQSHIDFIANHERAQQAVLRWPPKINGLHEHFVEVLIAVPPAGGLAGTQGSSQGIRRGREGRTGPGNMQCHDIGPWIGQNKQVTSRQLPDASRGVLNGRAISCGHERAHGGKIREKLRGTRQGFFPLALEILKGEHGVR